MDTISEDYFFGKTYNPSRKQSVKTPTTLQEEIILTRNKPTPIKLPKLVEVQNVPEGEEEAKEWVS